MAVKNSGRLALTGVMTALALVLLLLTAVPFSNVSLAAVAGLCGIPVVVEIGRKKALIHYVAVSLLALLLVPPTGGRILYVVAFGHYTIFKAWIESRNLSRLWEWIIKIGLFLVLLLAGAALLIRAPLSDLWKDVPFTLSPVLFTILGIGVITAVFVVYDVCMSRLVSLYHHRLRAPLRRWFRF